MYYNGSEVRGILAVGKARGTLLHTPPPPPPFFVHVRGNLRCCLYIYYNQRSIYIYKKRPTHFKGACTHGGSCQFIYKNLYIFH